MPQVAALYVMRDSVYKAMPVCSCYDEERDARTYIGDLPVVAHPPCRTWGVLRHLATRALPGEHELGILAVEQVRRWGGVLEHPAGSRLFAECGCPLPGDASDEYGGWTMVLDQWDWGHACSKPTRLYVVRATRIPPFPPTRAERPTRAISTGHGVRVGHPTFRSRVTDRERKATPPEFARWLVALARSCRPMMGGR